MKQNEKNRGYGSYKFEALVWNLKNKSYQAYFVDVECLILRNTFEELDLWITLNPIFRSNVSTQIINAIKPKIWKTKTNYLANHNPQETRISNNINIEIARIQIWRSKYDLSPKIEKSGIQLDSEIV